MDRKIPIKSRMNGLRTPRASSFNGHHRRGGDEAIAPHPPSRRRQSHRESRAAAGNIGRSQLPAHRADQVHGDRQPKPRSLTAFGGEERLEQMRERRRGNSPSAVLHMNV